MESRFFAEKTKTVKIKDEGYPQALRKIPGAPEILYFRGKLFTDEPCFAIVGTRRCSDYGKEIAFSFARELSKAGLSIVSGMARGIDSFAHRGVIAEGRRTIAVLGTGLNEQVIYPRENLGLAREILGKGGCLMSEYPPDTHGDRYTFPKRNRIIATLSMGVLVVEAKFGSGALITAKYAKQQGKKVFAIPGSIHSLNSRGPNTLIKQGAALVEKPSDILKALEIPMLPLPYLSGHAPNRHTQSLGLSGPAANAPRVEQAVMQALTKGGLHIDKIIETTGLSPQAISGALSLMEIEGKIKNLGGNVYALSC